MYIMHNIHVNTLIHEYTHKVIVLSNNVLRLFGKFSDEILRVTRLCLSLENARRKYHCQIIGAHPVSGLLFSHPVCVGCVVCVGVGVWVGVCVWVVVLEKIIFLPTMIA